MNKNIGRIFAAALVLCLICAMLSGLTMAYAAENTVLTPGQTEFDITVTIPGITTAFGGVDIDVIIDNGSDLKIKTVSFPGNENGRVADPRADGDQISYMVGLSSANGQNQYIGDVDMCTITFTYTGTQSRVITIKNIVLHRLVNMPGEAPESNDETLSLEYVYNISVGNTAAVPPASSAPGTYIPEESIPGESKPVADLDKSNQKAYLFGYPDGTVLPGNNITRAETASMLYALVTNGEKGDYKDFASNFSDVGNNKWYSEAVGFFAAAEIIKGYPDGTFMGEKAISRAEFAAILSRFSALNTNGELPFADAQAHWARSEILSAYNNKWVNGYPDGTFRPDQNITRSEAVAMVNRMIGRDLSQYEGYPMKFSDVPATAWYYKDIIAASNDK